MSWQMWILFVICEAVLSTALFFFLLGMSWFSKNVSITLYQPVTTPAPRRPVLPPGYPMERTPPDYEDDCGC